jgi:hypothetical protein
MKSREKATKFTVPIVRRRTLFSSPLSGIFHSVTKKSYVGYNKEKRPRITEKKNKSSSQIDNVDCRVDPEKPTVRKPR